MKFKKLVIIFLVSSLTGCATQTPPLPSTVSASSKPPLSNTSTAPIVSNTQSSSRTTPHPNAKENTSRLYFYRAPGLFGAALQPPIILDGVNVGQSKPGSLFFIDTFAGNHEVIAANKMDNEADKKLTFSLNPHDTQYIKTSVGTGASMGRIIAERVSPSIAQKEITNLNLSESR